MSRTFEETKGLVIRFMKDNNLDAWTLCHVAKQLCRCGFCKFFIQHYNSKGQELDFGHCVKGNTPKSKKPYDQSCGFWESAEDVRKTKGETEDV